MRRHRTCTAICAVALAMASCMNGCRFAFPWDEKSTALYVANHTTAPITLDITYVDAASMRASIDTVAWSREGVAPMRVTRDTPSVNRIPAASAFTDAAVSMADSARLLVTVPPSSTLFLGYGRGRGHPYRRVRHGACEVLWPYDCAIREVRSDAIVFRLR